MLDAKALANNKHTIFRYINKNTIKHLSIQRNIYQKHNTSPYLKRIKDDSHFKQYHFGQTIQLWETHAVVIPISVGYTIQLWETHLWTLAVDISFPYFEKWTLEISPDIILKIILTILLFFFMYIKMIYTTYK